MILNNKRILITGATSGIGKVAAKELAKQGAHVIIHGRNPEKADQVKHEILRDIPLAKVDVMLANLSNKSEVLTLVDTFNHRFGSLNVLVNNAGGVMNNQREVTADGWEKTIAVNVLAPFMLSALLYPNLQRQAGSRIIHTASAAHRMARPDLTDLMYEKKYSALRAYGDAKLYVILMGQEFAKRQRELSGHHVTMNAFHPGVVATNFAGESNSLYHFFFKVFRLFLTSPEKGADTMIYLAADERAGNLNGKYFVKRKEEKVYLSKKYALLSSNLWNQWETYSGIKFL